MLETLRVHEHLRRLVLRVVRRIHVHGQVAQRRVVQRWTFERLLVVKRRRCKGLRWRLRVSLVHLEWVDILERRMLHLRCELWVESVEGSDLMSSMQGAFGSWQRKRCADAHVERRRVEITGLRVINRVGTTWSGSVVAGHVVRKHAEPVVVGIHEGRS